MNELFDIGALKAWDQYELLVKMVFDGDQVSVEMLSALVDYEVKFDALHRDTTSAGGVNNIRYQILKRSDCPTDLITSITQLKPQSFALYALSNPNISPELIAWLRNWAIKSLQLTTSIVDPNQRFLEKVLENIEGIEQRQFKL